LTLLRGPILTGVGLLQRGEPAILILKRFCVVSAI